MADDQNKKRKFNKSRYFGANRKRRGLDALAAGMCGVLISCNEKDKTCVREAYNVLNEYADKVYGSQFSSQTEENSSNEEDDIEKAIDREKQEMKTEHKRFQSVKSDVKNVLFIRTLLPDDGDISDLVHTILSDILENGHQKTRYCLRFLPITACCYANMDQIEKTAKELFKKSFLADDVMPVKFSIVYKSRYNDTIHRDETISTLASLVTDSGKNHSVDLSNPDLTICVEIIRKICCLSVVKDFHKLKKYNIQEVQNSTNIPADPATKTLEINSIGQPGQNNEQEPSTEKREAKQDGEEENGEENGTEKQNVKTVLPDLSKKEHSVAKGDFEESITEQNKDLDTGKTD